MQLLNLKENKNAQKQHKMNYKSTLNVFFA